VAQKVSVLDLICWELVLKTLKYVLIYVCTLQLAQIIIQTNKYIIYILVYIYIYNIVNLFLQ